jgi:hypothetical protein
LHWAAWNGQLHTVRALLEFKAAQLLALRAERACREQAARAQSGNGDDQASPTPSPLSTDKSARPVQLTQALAPLRLQHLFGQGMDEPACYTRAGERGLVAQLRDITARAHRLDPAVIPPLQAGRSYVTEPEPSREGRRLQASLLSTDKNARPAQLTWGASVGPLKPPAAHGAHESAGSMMLPLPATALEEMRRLRAAVAEAERVLQPGVRWVAGASQVSPTPSPLN